MGPYLPLGGRDEADPGDQLLQSKRVLLISFVVAEFACNGERQWKPISRIMASESARATSGSVVARVASRAELKANQP